MSMLLNNIHYNAITNNIYRKLNLNSYINTQKSEAKMIKNFRKKYGDKNKIESGEMLAISGIIVAIEANAYPVDHAENNPQTIPNPGINMGNAIVVLCTKIPNPSISKTSFLNSSMNILASSSLTVDIEPS